MIVTLKKTKRHLPAVGGLWVFILGDMIIFGLFFGAFMVNRAQDVETFILSQRFLNQHYGAINTFFLITSSWLVALALQAARNKKDAVVPKLIAIAFFFGLGFIVIKIIEYGEKIGAGITLVSDDFFMYYYMYTGIHLLHLLLGMGALFFLWTMSRKGDFTDTKIKIFEGGAAYWHMVDLLWIVLYPLLYLVR